MAATLFSNTARVALRSGASATSKAGAAGLTFARGKATLPDLSCKLSILVPGEVQKGIHFGLSCISVN
jgi:Fe-Mn family superoxide dismutase